ncbi:MAG: T9SS type A sorting domain-containing protein, partial [Chlorobi bacterium]|nr:T9SS type A sorting domain-containing protein [Chlorobiota bacterium]
TNTFYVHRLRNSSGVGGFIMVIDKDGNLLDEYASPAKEYPVGLTLVGDRMWVADRDGSRWLYLIKPETYPDTKFEIKKILNPYAEYYGPRGLCFDGDRSVYQASTKFSAGSGGLIETAIIKLDKDDMTTILDTILLTSRNGAINCRGIEYDSRDKNFWISDFTGSKGSIYKIAGFSTISDVEEAPLNELLPLTDVQVYPNPVRDMAIVSFTAPLQTTSVTIDLYNIVGIKLKTIYAGNIGGGSIKTFNFDAGGLTPGMYNLMIRTDGNCLFTKKITIIK